MPAPLSAVGWGFNVAAMIAHRSRPSDQVPDTGPIAIGARLLRVASDFDELVMRGVDLESALVEMRTRKEYIPRLLDALEEVQVDVARNEARLVSLAHLRTGMIINGDVRSKAGLLLLAQGQEVTDSAIERLKSFAFTRGIVEPISVIVPHVQRESGEGRMAEPTRDGVYSGCVRPA